MRKGVGIATSNLVGSRWTAREQRHRGIEEALKAWKGHQCSHQTVDTDAVATMVFMRSVSGAQARRL